MVELTAPAQQASSPVAFQVNFYFPVGSTFGDSTSDVTISGTASLLSNGASHYLQFVDAGDHQNFIVEVGISLPPISLNQIALTGLSDQRWNRYRKHSELH